MSETQWHYCWVGPRQRVQRRGLPLDCMQCRKSSKRHKCGMDPDYATAWKSYPVTDCAGCTRIDQRTLARGPSSTLVRERTREDRDPSDGKVPKHGVSRAQLRAARARRKQLIMVGIMHGLELAPELFRMLDRFGAPITRRALYDDLSELVKDRWLIRVKEKRDDSLPHQRDWHWRYSVSPAIEEKMRDDK